MISKKNIFIAENLGDLYNKIFPSGGLNDILHTRSDRKDPSASLDEELNPSKILWFRGQTNSSWPLQPSLYRKIKAIIRPHGEKRSDEFERTLKDRELKIYNDFRTRAHHLINNPQENYFLWMSLMQHYGVATRLLDWSEEINAALFFALEKYFEFGYQGDKYFPCVWILNPYKLWYNANCFFKGKKWDGSQLKRESVIPSLLDLDRPGKIQHSLPIPVIAPYTHDRIRVQTGAFVLFPKLFPYNDRLNIDASENLSLESLPYAQDCLIQIVFTKPWLITDELISIGLKRSLFYPELPNVSAETQQKFLRERKRR
jgi:hypothetical protein